MRNLKAKLARLLVIICASATLVFGMQPSIASAGGNTSGHTVHIKGGVSTMSDSIGGPIGGGGGG